MGELNTREATTEEIERWQTGDHRLGLNVFGHNDVARNLYESLGYQTVDQSRSRDL
jgi:ribosomal protein S18 acetylase RimI-like enzyme